MTGKALREYLFRCGLTYQEFALIVGVTPSAAGHWVSDRRGIPETVVRLIEYFEEDIEKFHALEGK